MAAVSWKRRQISRERAIYAVLMGHDYSLRTIANSDYVDFTHETVRKELNNEGLLAVILACVIPEKAGSVAIDGTGSSPHVIMVVVSLAHTGIEEDTFGERERRGGDDRGAR